MSNYKCEKCGTDIIEGEGGFYITECEHYRMKSIQEEPKIHKVEEQFIPTTGEPRPVDQKDYPNIEFYDKTPERLIPISEIQNVIDEAKGFVNNPKLFDPKSNCDSNYTEGANYVINLLEDLIK